MTDSLLQKGLLGIRGYTGGHILAHVFEIAAGVVTGIYAADPLKGMLLGAVFGAGVEVFYSSAEAANSFLFKDETKKTNEHWVRDAIIKGAILGAGGAAIGGMSGIPPVPVVSYSPSLSSQTCYAINASNITNATGGVHTCIYTDASNITHTTSCICKDAVNSAAMSDPLSPTNPAFVFYNPASPLSVYNY